MKLSNISMLLLAGSALFGATSCVETAEYEPAAPVPLAPYYFSTGNADYVDLGETQTSVSILLGRIDATEALTLKVQHNEDLDYLLNVPTEVSFDAGEATAELVVNFDVANFEKRKEYKLNLKLDGIENTPYYLGDLSVTFFYNPWTSLGTGYYTDVVVGSIFSDVDYYTYEVEVQEHPTTPGYYRVVNPYGPGIYPMTSAMDYGSENRYLYVHAEDPEYVYTEQMNTGWSGGSSYGYVQFTSDVWEEVKEISDPEKLAEALAKLKEDKKTGSYEEDTKNIVMPAGTVKAGMSLYQNGAYSSVTKEDLVIVLPGGKIKSDWDELGFYNFTDGFAGPFMSTPVLNNTYPVLVEYNSKENVYRIVDPYGPNSGYTQSASLEQNYIYFNMENPNCVTVGEVKTPISSLRTGIFYATTMADQELTNTSITKEELAEAGIGGTFDGKVIRIPGDQITGWYSRKPETLVYAATPVDVVLDLSEPTVDTQAMKARRNNPNAPLQLRK